MQFLLSIFIFILVFLFGVTLASFLNVLVYRVPRQLDFVSGRSFCPNCEHPLAAADLIPVASYLLLGRRCRYCHQPISARYMLVELSGGILALLSWWAFLGADAGASLLLGKSADKTLLVSSPWLLANWSSAIAAIIYFAALCILLTISIIDADTMEIPDGLNIALALLGLLSLLAGPDISLVSRAIGLLAVSLPMFLLAIIVPGAFGGGDIKLMAAAGILLGWQQLLVAFFIGLVVGGAYGICALISRKKGLKEHFAFGPALCLGVAVAMFFGSALINGYLGLL
jgi:leader peptidase (prepilin peptidase)/N-methyltransferase